MVNRIKFDYKRQKHKNLIFWQLKSISLLDNIQRNSSEIEMKFAAVNCGNRRTLKIIKKKWI